MSAIGWGPGLHDTAFCPGAAVREAPSERHYLYTADGERFYLESAALVCWLDETGHEMLAAAGHPVFGFGGCATLGTDYAREIHHPWRRMKQDHFGGADAQIHASDPELPKQQERLDALAVFFKTQTFHRLAVVVTDKAEIRRDEPPHAIVADQLMRIVLDLAFPSGRQLADSVVLVFEHSQRGNALVNQHIFAAFDEACMHFLEGSGIVLRRWPPPFRTGFLRKAAGAPGLEVADFVIQSAGNQAQQSAANWKANPRKDFQVVFHDPAAARGLSHFRARTGAG